MRLSSALLFLFLISACGDNSQPTNISTSDTVKLTDNHQGKISQTVSNVYGFDTSYEISKGHQPYLVTGYFNTDNILDTAIIIRHKSTGKDALFIKHGGTEQPFLLKDGNSVGSDFADYNWIGQFEVVKKGTKIWDNVIDGEIVGEDQVPDSKKIILLTDAIFVHVDEASGGGIIYYKNGKYVWIQQD